MADFTVSKDTTIKAIKDATKAEVMQVITDALIAAYGEDNVGMVRTGSGQSKKNELAVRAKTADLGQFEVPVCVTITGAAKDFTDRATDKKTYIAFDFEAMRTAYEDYLIEKEEKATAKAAAKEKQIAADKKRRAAKSEG